MAIVVAVVVAIIIARSVFECVEKNTYISNRWIKSRATESISFLRANGEILDTFIPIIGASEIQTVADPVEINKLLQKNLSPFKVLNYGFMNLTILQMEALARELGRSTKESGKLFPMIILDVPPNMLTNTVQADFKTTSDDEMLLSISDYHTLLTLTDINLLDKVSLLFLKFAFGAHDPKVNAYYVNWKLHTLFTRMFKVQPKNLDATRNILEFWYSPQLHSYPAWDINQLGRFEWQHSPADENYFKSTLERYRHPDVRETVKQGLIKCCDSMELKFNDKLLARLHRVIGILKASTHKLILTNIPYSPDFGVNSDTRNRVKGVLRTLAEEQTVPIYFMEDSLKLYVEDYFDGIHLRGEGVKKFNGFIAEIVYRNQK